MQRVRQTTVNGPAERAYWDLRAPGSPDPAEDAGEGYLLAYARMLDASERATLAGTRSLIVEWQLPVATGSIEAASRELAFLCASTTHFELSTLWVDHDQRRVHVRALLVGPDAGILRERVRLINESYRTQIDRPGARLRPPRITDGVR